MGSKPAVKLKTLSHMKVLALTCMTMRMGLQILKQGASGYLIKIRRDRSPSLLFEAIIQGILISSPSIQKGHRRIYPKAELEKERVEDLLSAGKERS